MIDCECPYCSNVIRLPEERAGSHTWCDGCKRIIPVRVAEGGESNAAAEPRDETASGNKTNLVDAGDALSEEEEEHQGFFASFLRATEADGSMSGDLSILGDDLDEDAGTAWRDEQLDAAHRSASEPAYDWQDDPEEIVDIEGDVEDELDEDGGQPEDVWDWSAPDEVENERLEDSAGTAEKIFTEEESGDAVEEQQGAEEASGMVEALEQHGVSGSALARLMDVVENSLAEERESREHLLESLREHEQKQAELRARLDALHMTEAPAGDEQPEPEANDHDENAAD
jgi:hypothetical protein